MAILIAQLDIKRFLSNPRNGIPIAILQGILAILLKTFIQKFSAETEFSIQGFTESVLHPFFGWLGLFFLLFTPFLTAPAICEERKNNTFILYTLSSLTHTQFIMGKYLGLLGKSLIFLVLPLSMPLYCGLMHTVDLSHMLSCVLGLSLFIMSILSMGLLCSCIFHAQTTAAISTLLLLVFCSSLEWFGYAEFSLLAHYDKFLCGNLTLTDLSYYIVLTGLCLQLSILALSHNFKKTGLIVLVLCLSQILTYSVPTYWDLTKNHRNTLSLETELLLSQITSPLTITLYSPNMDYETQFQSLITLYSRTTKSQVLFKKNLGILPKDIQQDYQLQEKNYAQFTYLGHSKFFELSKQPLTEKIITHWISETIQFSQGWIVFLTGHGEPTLNHWTQALKKLYIQSTALNLNEIPIIPNNTRLLVLACPTTELQPREMNILKTYLYQGGNLLWLTDDLLQTQHSPLNEIFQLKWYAPYTDLADPLLFSQYPKHPLTHQFTWTTQFLNPLSFEIQPTSVWKSEPFLTKDHHVLGSLLTGKQPNQKIIIMGNGRFLSDSEIYRAGNLQLAKRLALWMTEKPNVENLTEAMAVDLDFKYHPLDNLLLYYGFPYVFPLLVFSVYWILPRFTSRIN